MEPTEFNLGGSRPIPISFAPSDKKDRTSEFTHIWKEIKQSALEGSLAERILSCFQKHEYLRSKTDELLTKERKKLIDEEYKYGLATVAVSLPVVTAGWFIDYSYSAPDEQVVWQMVLAFILASAGFVLTLCKLIRTIRRKNALNKAIKLFWENNEESFYDG